MPGPDRFTGADGREWSAASADVVTVPRPQGLASPFDAQQFRGSDFDWTMGTGTNGVGGYVVNRGTHNINANVAFNDHTNISVDWGATLNVAGFLNNSTGRTLTKAGDGILNITGTQNHGPGAVFNATGGVTNCNTDAGAVASNLAVNATGATTRVNFNSDQHLRSLGVSSGATADVLGNAVTIDYTGASPVARFIFSVFDTNGHNASGDDCRSHSNV